MSATSELTGFLANATVLPAGYGSAASKARLVDLGLLPLVSMARQDSGRLARFAAVRRDLRTRRRVADGRTGLNVVACRGRWRRAAARTLARLRLLAVACASGYGASRQLQSNSSRAPSVAAAAHITAGSAPSAHLNLKLAAACEARRTARCAN